MKRKQPLTWRKFEFTMRIPARLSWSTARAQEFVDLYAAHIGTESKPIVFDLATKGRGSRYYGMHRKDRISLSLELDSDERWRTLVHEVAHFRYRHSQKKLFLLEIQYVYEVFQQWLRGDLQ